MNTQAELDSLKKNIESYIDLIDNEYNQLKGILSEVGTDAFATANGIAIGNGEIKNSSSFAIQQEPLKDLMMAKEQKNMIV